MAESNKIDISDGDDATKSKDELLEEVVKVGHTMDFLKNALMEQQNFVRYSVGSRLNSTCGLFNKQELVVWVNY